MDTCRAGVHKSRGTKFFMVACQIFVGPRYGNCLMSHFWRPEFFKWFSRLLEKLCTRDGGTVVCVRIIYAQFYWKNSVEVCIIVPTPKDEGKISFNFGSCRSDLTTFY